jgi:uncharacterized delta-60 repeat protein
MKHMFIKFRLGSIILTLIVLFLSAACTPAEQSPPKEQYTIKYSGAGGSYAYALVVDNNGNIYIAGYTGYTFGPGFRDYTVMKYGSDGKKFWTSIYNSPGAGVNVARSLAVDPSGNVYVTGQSQGVSTGNDYTTIKYDSKGIQLWVARYNGPDNGDDAATSLAIDNTGVYVTGSSQGTNSGKDFLTIKYDLDGNKLWEARYNSPENGDDFAQTLVIDNSGNVYVTGTGNGTQGAEGGSSYLPQVTNPSGAKGYYTTIKYDRNGQQLWVSQYKATGYLDDIPHAIKVDSSGNVYVTGESMNSDTGYDYATIKYNTDGRQQWAVRYEGNMKGADGAFAMTLDNSGNILVTGYSTGLVNGMNVWEYATIKYDTGGNLVWVARYSGPRGDNIPYSITTDSDENVYVTGVSGFIKYDNTAYENYATVKYNKNGNQLWSARYSDSNESNNIAEALALDASGNVYVTGVNYPKGADYAAITIIKYVQK